MSAGKIDTLEARERQLRDAASRKGMLVRKGLGDHGMILVSPDLVGQVEESFRQVIEIAHFSGPVQGGGHRR